MGIEPLEPLIGEWKLDADIPGSEGVDARSVFEPILGGVFLLQRTVVDHPDAPDSHCIISANGEGNGYTQHFFDSRGVVRVYAMTFEDGKWGLSRESPDFTPLDFSQRFFGELSADGKRIDGRWEMSEDGSDWRLDFHLNYTRVS